MLRAESLDERFVLALLVGLALERHWLGRAQDCDTRRTGRGGKAPLGHDDRLFEQAVQSTEQHELRRLEVQRHAVEQLAEQRRLQRERSAALGLAVAHAAERLALDELVREEPLLRPSDDLGLGRIEAVGEQLARITQMFRGRARQQ
eukprot:1163381-Prymnesium_polylepis.1